MEELDALKKRFRQKTNRYKMDNDFENYSKIYPHTNENLNEYIDDLSGKTVLTVSASGDQKLNMIGKGAKRIDTFDINKYSPLYENLKLCAVRYLDYEEGYKFLSKLDKDIYFKFNTSLAQYERIFFDYLFKNYDIDTIYKKLFEKDCKNYVINNNYFDENTFYSIKKRIRKVEMNHYSCNIYQAPNFFNTTYDRIYLSNISEYQLDTNRFLRYINYLKCFLSDEGKIYYAYLYNTYITDPALALCEINKVFKNYFEPEKYFDIIESTEVINVRGADNVKKKDSVLVLKK